MSRHINPKCLLCAHWTSQEARRLHGPAGDGCWDDRKCHKRRSHYRNRTERNHKRVIVRQSSKPDSPTITRLPLRTPQVFSTLILYLDNPRLPWKHTSIHAVSAELWINGEPKARIAPVHCYSLSAEQFKALEQQILQSFSEQYEIAKGLTAFVEVVRWDKLYCPVRPCPLYS